MRRLGAASLANFSFIPFTMTEYSIATLGMPIDEIDTPALLLDLDAFERNLKFLAKFAEEKSIRLRPHAKTHKCPAIARIQVEHGAVGVCCQKVSEAEAMVEGGIEDVLVSNEVVGPKKIERLVHLAKRGTLSVCVDNLENLKAINEAAHKLDAKLSVLIEVDVGGGRCGVKLGPEALELARKVSSASALSFKGLQAYHGRAQHIRSVEDRKSAIDSAVDKVKVCLELFEKDGIPCEIVTGAGSGTYPIETSSGVYNELQAGSYIFMDADYGRNLGENGQPWSDFEHSLFVYSTVMSLNSGRVGIVDAGLKALSVDSGMPAVARRGDAEYSAAGDEHGRVSLGDSVPDLSLGEKICLIPGHCDPTVNMHDWIVGIRNDMVETLWPVSARGPGV